MRIPTLFLSVLGLFTTMSVTAQNVALNFDANDDHITTTTPAISGNAERTIEAWIRTTATTDPKQGGKQKIITDMGAMSTGQRFTFCVLQNNAIRCEVGGSGIVGTKAVNDGKWHHVAVVYNPKATDNFRLLVDGVLDTKGNISTTVNTSTTNNFQIGMRVDGINHFDGDIDEVRLFKVARSDSAVKADMNMQYCKLPSSLIAYYAFNEGDPGKNNSKVNRTYDKTSNSKVGTLRNFALSGSSSNWVSGPSLSGGDTKSSLKAFDCTSYTGPSGKNTYTASGTYTEIIPNAAGCDSIITIDLTIGESTSYQEVTACDSFVSPTGKHIFKSGYHTDTLLGQNALGCDSVILTKLTLTSSSESYDTIGFCDSINIQSKWYFDDFQVDLYSQNQFGCDSVIHVSYLMSETSVSYIEPSACDSFLSPGGSTYHTTGSYVDRLVGGAASGCDSVINIKLTLHESVINDQSVMGCDSFVSAAGKAYFTEGIHEEMFSTSFGCDSIVRYDVRLEENKEALREMSVCDSVVLYGEWFSKSEVLEFTVPTPEGCDSLITVDLFVTSIDTSITRSGNELIANENNASYQWVNCSDNSEIIGATGKTFYPDREGEYAVQLTKNDCVKRSSCFVTSNASVSEFAQNLVNIYPNPSDGRLQLMNHSKEVLHYEVHDMSGKSVHRGILQRDMNLIDLNLDPGSYTLVFSGEAILGQKQLLLK